MRKESQIAPERAAMVTLVIEDGIGASNNHRGNLDIIADILDASHGGVKKTCLMYRCNLSFKQLKQYSHFLINNGLLHTSDVDPENRRLFEVTSKGKEFLRAYRGLKALMK